MSSAGGVTGGAGVGFPALLVLVLVEVVSVAGAVVVSDVVSVELVLLVVEGEVVGASAVLVLAVAVLVWVPIFTTEEDEEIVLKINNDEEVFLACSRSSNVSLIIKLLGAVLVVEEV